MFNTDIPSPEELPTAKSLVRSAFVATVVAAILMITIVMPAEYAIDPVGVGRLTGLTEMGEIKIQLEKEAEADRKRSFPAKFDPKSRSNLMERIIAAFLIAPAAAHESGHGPGSGAAMPGTTPMEADRKLTTVRTDEMSLTLDPGQGAEIKLVMRKGAKANYSWTAEGGKVNFDLHGDGPAGDAKSYKRGRAVAGEDGVLVAAFNGNHGWFWRNRTRKKVTVKLWTNGEYVEINRVM